MNDHEHWVALVRSAFPGIAVAQVETLPHLGWGGDSDAVLVNGELVVRFPRRPEVAQALAVEMCLLPKLACRLPVAIPDVQYVAIAAETGVPCATGYRLIPGRPLTAERFAASGDRAAIRRMATTLAAFLSTLHTFDIDEARACGVPVPWTDGRAQLEQARATIEALVLPVLDADVRQALDRLFAELLADPRIGRWPAVLCHGDLSTDHILATVASSDGAGGDDGRVPALTGIIDFGDVCIGDPTGDFLWRFDYGEDFYQLVQDAYVAPTADREAFDRVVAFRHQILPTTEIGYGVATGNAGYVEEGCRELRRRLALE